MRSRELHITAVQNVASELLRRDAFGRDEVAAAVGSEVDRRGSSVGFHASSRSERIAAGKVLLRAPVALAAFRARCRCACISAGKVLLPAPVARAVQNALGEKPADPRLFPGVRAFAGARDDF